MNFSQKKRLERAFAIEFLRLVGVKETIDPLHNESPDVLVRRYSNTLGVEVTQIYTGTNSQGISRITIEGGWDLVLSHLEQLAKDHQLPGMHADFFFDANYHVPKSNSKAMAHELLKLIENNLPEKESTYRMPHGYYGLPKGLLGFSIDRLIDYRPSLFTFADSIWVPYLSEDQIMEVISKKESLRTNYLKNCDEIWLLIVLYGGRASGLVEITESITSTMYQYKFDNVFLFDAITERIWKLNRS